MKAHSRVIGADLDSIIHHLQLPDADSIDALCRAVSTSPKDAGVGWLLQCLRREVELPINRDPPGLWWLCLSFVQGRYLKISGAINSRSH